MTTPPREPAGIDVAGGGSTARWTSPESAGHAGRMAQIMPALVIIAVVFGWATSLLVPILMHPTPARELDIVGTSWVVSRIHDAEIGAQDRARITFGIDRARVELGCGSITSRLVMDSDGAAMDVLGAADVVEACDGQLTSVERMQLEAIRDVFQWRIESPDRIVLEGGPAVTLDRVRVP